MTDMFRQWATAIANSLRAESEVAGGIISHLGRRGSEREGIVRAALTRILPGDVEVGTGQVVDAAGNISKQIDVVVARRNFPAVRFNDGSTNYLVESVIATIEVKSNLERRGLEQSIENCRSVSRLNSNYLQSCLPNLAAIHSIEFDSDSQPTGDPVNVGKFLMASKPATYVLGYDGAADIWSPFTDWYRRQDNDQLSDIPSLIVSMRDISQASRSGHNYIVRNDDATSIPDGRIPHVLTGTDSDPFVLFIMHMLRTIFRSCASAPTPMGFVFSARPHMNGAVFAAAEGLGDLRQTQLS